MKYRKDKYGNLISVLGYGCMRFTHKGTEVDFDKTEKEVLRGIELGINYFDTAYLYPGSEATLGRILEKNNLRDKVKIATKLPHYLVKKPEDFDKFFNEQLKRLKTNYIDYYLVHMLTDTETWNRLIKLGILEWIDKKKKSGEIRQFGFSYHGNYDMFKELVDIYPWEFTQIQYNYLDEHAQAGRNGLQYANLKGLPVIIMEPLRGGRLVNHLPKAANLAFKKAEIKRSPAEWGLGWLWNQKEVLTVLSGMNDMTQIEENASWADKSDVGYFKEEDTKTLQSVVDAINEKVKVPCTACRYCMPCPMGVDIPTTFQAYNRFYTDSKYIGLRDYVSFTVFRKDSPGPSKCISCGKCMKHCPQSIDIPTELKKAKKTMEFPGFSIARFVLKKLFEPK